MNGSGEESEINSIIPYGYSKGNCSNIGRKFGSEERE
jgi:hypothetical protein